LGTGAALPPAALPANLCAGRVRWTTEGLFIYQERVSAVAPGHADYFVLNMTTGVTRNYYEERFDAIAWVTDVSPDGRRVALQAAQCAAPDPGRLACLVWHSALYVLDVATGREVWVAGADAFGFMGTAFSPDGMRVAYTLKEAPYYSSIP
jgi:hypothetical protein